jgi:hypothetical protein
MTWLIWHAQWRCRFASQAGTHPLAYRIFRSAIL